MTTDTQQHNAAKTIADALQGDGQQAILEALSTGRVDLSLLRRFLGPAHLTQQQESILNLLVALQNNGNSHADASENTEPGGADAEIADLRQVNDTLAAALGACPVCWGGDRHCQGCNGHGAAGSALPDMELFEQLVAPAVRRVSAARQARRNGFARHRP